MALASPLAAHRLDEYLQATLLSLQADRVTLEVNLTPGVAVFETVRSLIDTNHDGQISAVEQQAYANRVLGDVALEVDRQSQHLVIVESQIPPLEEMSAGVGTIRLILRAEYPASIPGRHQLHFENRHQAVMGAYLVNALVPADGIRIERQSRDNRQTEIRIDYSVSSDAVKPTIIGNSDSPRWPLVAGLSLAALLGSLWQRYSHPLVQIPIHHNEHAIDNPALIVSTPRRTREWERICRWADGLNRSLPYRVLRPRSIISVNPLTMVLWPQRV